MWFASLILTACYLTAHASVSGYIGPSDQTRLLEASMKALVKLQAGDVSTMYYGAKGFKLLNTPLPRVTILDCCTHLKHHFKSDSKTEEVFHALSSWSLLNCSTSLKPNVTESLHTQETIKLLEVAVELRGTGTVNTRYAIEALRVLNVPLANPAKVAENIQAYLKTDDSLSSLGHALHASFWLGNHGKFILDRIEDIVVQADEVDGRMLQWEGGLTTTSLLLTGLLKHPSANVYLYPQASKFANYLLSRRSVQTPRGALALLESALALSKSDVAPVSITVIGSAQVTPDKPELNIRISSFFGNPLKSPPTPVVAQSATRITDDVVVLSKQPFSPGDEPTVFKLPLRLDPGQYRVALSAGTHSATLTVRVLGAVTLQSLDIGIADVDGTSAPRFTKLEYRSELQAPLQVDSSHSLMVKFSLSRNVHQAFLRLHSGEREVIFISERDANQLYKINVNVASEIRYAAKFQIELIIGDPSMSNPIRWNLGDVEVKLPASEPFTKKVKTGPKPEIKHLFRKPEARPPQFVSMLFTGFAAMPLLILLILWLKIGINLKNIGCYALPFHFGLASILILFGLFWWRFDMFFTCYSLVPVGCMTFLSGNYMLNKIAKQKK